MKTQTEIEIAQLVLDYFDEDDKARREQMEIMLRARAKRTVEVGAMC